MEEGFYRLLALIGFCGILLLAWATGNRGKVNLKTVRGSLVLIWLIGGLTFWLPWSRMALEWINNVLVGS